jgi:hypothetical protein
MRRSSDDTGSITLFSAIAGVGLLVLAGLVVDGGGKVRAAQRSDRIAAEAGRAAGQQIDVGAAIEGSPARLDPAAALAAAREYLRREGVEGDAAISGDGRRVVVRVWTAQPTVFLSLVGVSEVRTEGTAEVQLVSGAEEIP